MHLATPERLEDVIQVLGGDPRPLVRHRECPPPPLLPIFLLLAPDSHRPPAAVLDGVGDEVLEHEADQFAVAAHRGVGGHLDGQCHALLFGLLGELTGHLPAQGVQAHRPELRLGLLVPQPLGLKQPAHAAHRAEDRLLGRVQCRHLAGELRGRAQLAPQDLQPERDVPEVAAQVVAQEREVLQLGFRRHPQTPVLVGDEGDHRLLAHQVDGPVQGRVFLRGRPAAEGVPDVLDNQSPQQAVLGGQVPHVVVDLEPVDALLGRPLHQPFHLGGIARGEGVGHLAQDVGQAVEQLVDPDVVGGRDVLAHQLQPLPQDGLGAGPQCVGEFGVRPLGERASDGIKVATAGLLFLGHWTVAPVRWRRIAPHDRQQYAKIRRRTGGPDHREKVTFRPSKGCQVWASASAARRREGGRRRDVSYRYYCRGSQVFGRLPESLTRPWPVGPRVRYFPRMPTAGFGCLLVDEGSSAEASYPHRR